MEKMINIGGLVFILNLGKNKWSLRVVFMGGLFVLIDKKTFKNTKNIKN